MTGTPVGPPHPSGPSYCSVAHRWVGWDMKGLTRCWGCFSAFVLHESHEGFGALHAGTEAENTFPTARSSTEYFRTQVSVSYLILNRYLPLCVMALDTAPSLPVDPWPHLMEVRTGWPCCCSAMCPKTRTGLNWIKFQLVFKMFLLLLYRRRGSSLMVKWWGRRCLYSDDGQWRKTGFCLISKLRSGTFASVID